MKMISNVQDLTFSSTYMNFKYVINLSQYNFKYSNGYCRSTTQAPNVSAKGKPHSVYSSKMNYSRKVDRGMTKGQETD